MWFCCHISSSGTLWGVLLASPLCCGSNSPSPRCLLRHMPIMPSVPFRLMISFRVEPPTDSLCCMLVLVMVFAFCFQAPIFSNGTQLLDLAIPQPYREYTWWAYVCSGDGPWSVPMPVLLLSLLWVGGTSCYSFCCPLAITSTCWGIQLWGLGQESLNLSLPYMVGRGLLFQVLVHPMTCLTLKLWSALNLVILVW